MNYLEERLAKYHITEKDNTMKVAAEDPGHFVDFKFFTEQPVKDKDGKVTGTDIAINYLTPAGEVEYYNHGNSQTRRHGRHRREQLAQARRGLQPPKAGRRVPTDRHNL